MYKSMNIVFTDVSQDVHGMGIGNDISNLKNAKPLRTFILMIWQFYFCNIKKKKKSMVRNSHLVIRR